jgi:hypothetical protein
MEVCDSCCETQRLTLGPTPADEQRLPPRFFSTSIDDIHVAKALQKDRARDFAARLSATTRFPSEVPMQLCWNSDSEHGRLRV